MVPLNEKSPEMGCCIEESIHENYDYVSAYHLVIIVNTDKLGHQNCIVFYPDIFNIYY